jgi:hypothetical protein
MRAAFCWARQPGSAASGARRRNRCGLHPAACTARPQANCRPALRSCETSRRQLLLSKVRYRQHETILLSPEITDLLAELDQFCPLIAGERPLLRGTQLTMVDSCLTIPLSQSAVGQAKPLRHSCVAKAFTEPKGYSLWFLLCRKLVSGHCLNCQRKAVGASWRDAYRPVHETGLIPQSAKC